jgi:hydrogenase maturation protease
VKRVIIGGIGNVLLGDDGVGPYVVRLLQATYDFEPNVEVEDLGTPALDLIDYISGRDALILIDSAANAQAPGTVTLYRRDDVLRHLPGVRMDPHSPALGESLLTAELMGTVPREVLLIGVTGQSFAACCALSAPVRQAVDAVVQAVLTELGRLGVRFSRKSQADPEQIWWRPVTALRAIAE